MIAVGGALRAAAARSRTYLGLDAYATGRARACDAAARPLRPPRLPPLRRRARGPRSASATPFTEVDIEPTTTLSRAYLERIPVVALDGEELFELFVDEAELRDAAAVE